jgi:hypothetical protein
VIPVAFAFQGQGHFLSDTWSGDLRLNDESRQLAIHIDESPAKLAMTGQSTQWRWDNAFGLLKFYGRLPASPTAANPPAYLQNWKLDYTSQGGAVTATHNATLDGGLTEANLQIQPQAARRLIQGSIGAKEVPLASLCAPVGGCSSLEGKLSAVAPHFQVSIATDPWAGMSGDATIEVTEGRYHLPEASLQRLGKTHLLKYMKKKFEGFAEQGLVFSKLHAHATMSSGLLNVDSAMLDAGDVRAALVGKFDPSHKGVDATLCLQIHEHTPGRLELIPGKYIIGETGSEHIQPIYGHLQGTIDEWSLRSLQNFKVPAKTKAQLSKALAQK